MFNDTIPYQTSDILVGIYGVYQSTFPSRYIFVRATASFQLVSGLYYLRFPIHSARWIYLGTRLPYTRSCSCTRTTRLSSVYRYEFFSLHVWWWYA
jgi:hypothetical protein